MDDFGYRKKGNQDTPITAMSRVTHRHTSRLGTDQTRYSCSGLSSFWDQSSSEWKIGQCPSISVTTAIFSITATNGAIVTPILLSDLEVGLHSYTLLAEHCKPSSECLVVVIHASSSSGRSVSFIQLSLGPTLVVLLQGTHARCELRTVEYHKSVE